MKFLSILVGGVFICTGLAQAQEADLALLQDQAKNGKIEAATRLGKYYFDIEKDIKKAETWIKAAADAGDAEAQYYLAKIYDAGTEGKHPNKEIVSILQSSAEQGYTPSQIMLGKIYQFGRRGIPKDLQKAKILYELAAAKGANEAMTQLRVIYKQLGDSKNNAILKDENVEWLELGVKQGNTEAALTLGKMLETGNHIPKDLKRAVKLYQMAADDGLVEGQTALGRLYANGSGVRQDREKAVSFLTKAAEQGYAEAQRKLAWVYTRLYSDPIQAYAWQVISLSSLFPNADDLVRVSPELEDLLRLMTPEQVEKAELLALKEVEIIKENRRQLEEQQKEKVRQAKRYQEEMKK